MFVLCYIVCTLYDTTLVERVHAWGNWVLPVLPAKAHVNGMNSAHSMKLTLDNEGKVRLQSKEWPTDPVWLPDKGYVLMEKLPKGSPHLAPIKYVDYEVIKTSIQKLSVRVDFWDVCS
jgi:hypothetical protein